MKEFEKVIMSYAEAASAGKTEEAHSAALQALIMAGAEALKNPTPALLLREEADDLESKGDWSGAEAVRRKVLALEASSGNLGIAVKAQMELCRLLRSVGRSDEACELASVATDSARRTGIFPLLVMALENEIFCVLDRGDFPKALAAASEAVQVIEPGKLYDQTRAKALTARARCWLANDSLASAETDLASGWELLQAQSGSCIMPGPIHTLANWWEVRSQFEERQGNLQSAKEAMKRAIEYRRQLQGPYALLVLARALDGFAKISRADGDLSGEEQALNEAKSIREGLHLPLAN